MEFLELRFGVRLHTNLFVVGLSDGNSGNFVGLPALVSSSIGIFDLLVSAGNFVRIVSIRFLGNFQAFSSDRISSAISGHLAESTGAFDVASWRAELFGVRTIFLGNFSACSFVRHFARCFVGQLALSVASANANQINKHLIFTEVVVANPRAESRILSRA